MADCVRRALYISVFGLAPTRRLLFFFGLAQIFVGYQGGGSQTAQKRQHDLITPRPNPNRHGLLDALLTDFCEGLILTDF